MNWILLIKYVNILSTLSGVINNSGVLYNVTWYNKSSVNLKMITSYSDAITMLRGPSGSSDNNENKQSSSFQPLYDISVLDTDSESDDENEIDNDIQSMTTDDELSDSDTSICSHQHQHRSQSQESGPGPGSGIIESDKKEWCFLCEMSQNQREMEINPYVQKLLAFMKKTFPATDSLTFCKQTQHLYNKLIREFVRGKPHWKKKTIYEHVTQHCNENWAFKYSRYKELKEMINILSSNCIKNVKPNGEISLNVGNVSLYLRLIKEARTWMNK